MCVCHWAVDASRIRGGGEQVVNVARFRRADMWKYVLAVDASHGTYLYNWGDAQIRWLQVPS